MNQEEKIVIKALCFFHQDDRILVSKFFDRVKNENFYRILGGGVNFFETGEAGVRREIQEELFSEIENLRLIDIVENIFTYNGKRGHEIVFLYAGDLKRQELYSQNSIHIVEETYEMDAEWISLEKIINEKIPLYPVFDYKSLLS